MSDDAASVRQDLAFMRALVDDNGRSQMAFGVFYLAGGLIYATMLLVDWAEWTGALQLTSAQMWAVVGGANLAAVAVGVVAKLCLHTNTENLATRAFNAGFAGVSAAALTLCAVFALYAARAHSTAPWLMFVPVVFALQGGAWFTAFLLRRRGWLLLVALGWLSTALLGAWLGAQPAVALTYAAGFLLWMAAPGAVMIGLARRRA